MSVILPGDSVSVAFRLTLGTEIISSVRRVVLEGVADSVFVGLLMTFCFSILKARFGLGCVCCSLQISGGRLSLGPGTLQLSGWSRL